MSKLYAALLLFISTATAFSDGPYFASGIKIGEVNQDSAIVWVRLTQEKSAKFKQLPIFTEGLTAEIKDRNSGEMPTGVVSGINGEVRVTYWKKQINRKSSKPTG